ncbi:MAG: ribosome maturation factor RimM [Pseudomonadota bacterium]|nr:ribosome maturation factor RimM [Pseudomonadota bacterium]MDP1906343.1 ribosome maturation factor RimM [Pseudomonadota bacterium]MDP2351829.1 ribosome maturation factor RimM [Pseudomonadota bacterium]
MRLDSEDALVVMGRISAPYAIRGWVKIQAQTEYIDSLLGYPVWHVGRNGQWRQFRLVEGKVHGQYLLAHLQGMDDRDAAEAVMGMEIAVPRKDRPDAEDGEYYWDDLVGLEVVNTEGVVFGKVSGLLGTGAHDVLQVEGERERLIPFVDAYVREVDMAARRIVVDWGQDWGLD